MLFKKLGLHARIGMLALSAMVLYSWIHTAQAQDNPFEDEFFEEALDEDFFEIWDSAFDDPSDESVIDGLDDVETEIDMFGSEEAFREWLILVPDSQLNALGDIGIVTTESTRLGALGLVLIRLTTLGNASLSQTQQAIQAVAPDAEIDVNHLYGRASPVTQLSDLITTPRELLAIPAPMSVEGITIGIIDTDVNLQHEVLSQAQITIKQFSSSDNKRLTNHGTAILSLLAGRGEAYRGLLPTANYFCASVFFETNDRAQLAKTDAIIKALNWMAEHDVKIVNMSLAGPENRVLEKVISAFQNREGLIIAAVGNEGPAAKPRYPAAYDGVIGVTAINSKKSVYRHAGRGDHVDLSAPGVNVPHALASGGFGESSGTSMAAPFVTASIAVAAVYHDTSPRSAARLLVLRAEDLGEPGRDQIYGAGLVRLSLEPEGS